MADKPLSAPVMQAITPSSSPATPPTRPNLDRYGYRMIEQIRPHLQLRRNETPLEGVIRLREELNAANQTVEDLRKQLQNQTSPTDPGPVLRGQHDSTRQSSKSGRTPRPISPTDG